MYREISGEKGKKCVERGFESRYVHLSLRVRRGSLHVSHRLVLGGGHLQHTMIAWHPSGLVPVRVPSK